ncbi:single-stranded DNA-binding protein [Sphaerisporangium aureirubrum]|uniref:Single-stranded DNA-binding protein n=1 Tax=Sphaerisporangium aureirubrum TaxID=1544736 RepID=A0ABW1NQ12_9ACTN
MNDVLITLGGNVVGDPREYRLKDGTTATYLRIASTPRVFDKQSGTWRNGETAYYTIWCYRTLAENVSRSLAAGHPIVVHGRLRIKTYEKDGQRRHSAEVDATMLGHDLRWGVSEFGKAQRPTTENTTSATKEEAPPSPATQPGETADDLALPMAA